MFVLQVRTQSAAAFSIGSVGRADANVGILAVLRLWKTLWTKSVT